MGIISRSIHDWLGNRLDVPVVEGIYRDTQQAVMTKAALQVAVSYISAAIGKSEFKVYKNGKLVEKEWTSYLWTLSPNQNKNSSPFIADLLWNTFWHGRGIVVPWKSSIYLAETTSPERHPFQQDIYTGLVVDGEQVPQPSFKASDLYIFELGNPNIGDLVRGIQGQYGSMLAASMDAYKERNGKKFKLKIDATKAGSPEEVKKYQDFISNDLSNFMKSSSAVLPEYSGRSLEPLYQSASAGLSADFINLRKDCFEVVASIIKMPTSMMYGNVNNFKEVFKSFMTFTVAPVAEMMENEITRKNEAFAGWRNGSCVKIDLSNVKYTDLFDAAASADKLIASSLLSPDQVMVRLGLDPVGEPWSQKHYITKNYSLAGEQISEGGEEE
ncbi:MAG: phage portal protein [Raoultibacter sp.]